MFNAHKLEQLLEHLGEIVGADEPIDPKVLEKIITKLYEESVGTIRPLINVAPFLFRKIAKDSLPVAIGLVEIASTVRGDARFQAACQKLDKLKAEMQFQAMKAYIKAGFTREEAFNLLLQEIASFKTNFAKINSSGLKLSK